MTSHGPNPWPHRLAVVTTAATVLLIFVGGLVTNTGSALAVPDWPTTFGYNMFLYPWSRMVGGIFYEHSHRLIGSVVGLLTVSCALTLWWMEPRQWLRRLGALALLAVIIQGVLGGLRVVLLQHALAIIHGCLAQAFLALVVTVAVCSSSWWHTAARAQRPNEENLLRWLACLTPGLVYLQIVAGVLVTQTGVHLDLHLVCGGLATVSVLLFAAAVLRQPGLSPELRRPALMLALLVPLQLTLGLGAYLRRSALLPDWVSPALGLVLPVTHRMTGAFLLAISVVLGLRVLRVLVATRAPAFQTSFAPLTGRGGRQVPA